MHESLYSVKATSELPLDHLRESSYVTDGKRLFRCLVAERGPMLMLEDCRTLELFLCSHEELNECKMRIVRSGAGA